MNASDPVSLALVRLADGDRSAFDEVYDALGERMLALCRRLLGDPALADEAAQEALTRVFLHAERYDPARGSASAWALGIAAWQCKTLRRQQARSKETGDSASEPAHDHHPERTAVAADLLDAATAVLGELSIDDRQALLATWTDGPRPDVSPATFRKRVQRALTRFQRQWSARHG